MNDARIPAALAGGPLLVDAKRAAEMLSIGTRTLWSMTNAGEIPHVRIRSRVLYPVEELRRWVDKRRMSGR